MQIGIDSFAAAFDESSRAVSPSDPGPGTPSKKVLAEIGEIDELGLLPDHRKQLAPSLVARE